MSSTVICQVLFNPASRPRNVKFCFASLALLARQVLFYQPFVDSLLSFDLQALCRQNIKCYFTSRLSSITEVFFYEPYVAGVSFSAYCRQLIKIDFASLASLAYKVLFDQPFDEDVLSFVVQALRR